MINRSWMAAGIFAAVCVLPGVSSAATLCVSPTATSACPYATIGAAVAAASAGDTVSVSHGTYHEDVVIGVSISLIGENRANTIIDATGLANGIDVDGLNHPGLTGVSISNLTVQNAQIEGILLTNVSSSVVQNTHVIKNNIALDISTFTCPGIPNWETGEGFDCGEGIHLSGVDHSVIANNLVEQNSGGILLSDDTGATHDNLVMGNTVQDNPSDCGITLASHPLAGAGPTAAGVYHNTITGNFSKHNGYQVPGAGAGVGIFSPAPFTKNYGNVVVNNTLTDNGLPGVALHAHAPGATLNDNMIAGNTMARNGADTEDTFTSGPTGVNVSGGDNGSGGPLARITGTVVAGNTIRDESIGVAAKTQGLVEANLNPFQNVPTGIDNIGGGPVDAVLNWWGCSNGPGAPGCSSVTGPNIVTFPFLTQPF